MVGMQVKITSYYKFSVIYRKLLINLDEDICSMLAGTVEGVMLGNDVMAENFNVVEGCPYKVRQTKTRELKKINLFQRQVRFIYEAFELNMVSFPIFYQLETGV